MNSNVNQNGQKWKNVEKYCSKIKNIFKNMVVTLYQFGAKNTPFTKCQRATDISEISSVKAEATTFAICIKTISGY